MRKGRVPLFCTPPNTNQIQDWQRHQHPDEWNKHFCHTGNRCEDQNDDPQYFQRFLFSCTQSCNTSRQAYCLCDDQPDQKHFSETGQQRNRCRIHMCIQSIKTCNSRQAGKNPDCAENDHQDTDDFQDLTSF